MAGLAASFTSIIGYYRLMTPNTAFSPEKKDCLFFVGLGGQKQAGWTGKLNQKMMQTSSIRSAAVDLLRELLRVGAELDVHAGVKRHSLLR